MEAKPANTESHTRAQSAGRHTLFIKILDVGSPAAGGASPRVFVPAWPPHFPGATRFSSRLPSSAFLFHPEAAGLSSSRFVSDYRMKNM